MTEAEVASGYAISTTMSGHLIQQHNQQQQHLNQHHLPFDHHHHHQQQHHHHPLAYHHHHHHNNDNNHHHPQSHPHQVGDYQDQLDLHYQLHQQQQTIQAINPLQQQQHAHNHHQLYHQRLHQYEALGPSASVSGASQSSSAAPTEASTAELATWVNGDQHQHQQQHQQLQHQQQQQQLQQYHYLQIYKYEEDEPPRAPSQSETAADLQQPQQLQQDQQHQQSLSPDTYAQQAATIDPIGSADQIDDVSEDAADSRNQTDSAPEEPAAAAPTLIQLQSVNIEQRSNHIVVSDLRSGRREVLTNDQLTGSPVRLLNKTLAGFPKKTISRIKQLRRTLKNRGYAQICRTKRLDQKNKLERRNTELLEDNRRKDQQIAELEKRCAHLIATLRHNANAAAAVNVVHGGGRELHFR